MPKSHFTENRIMAAVRAYEPGKEFTVARVVVDLGMEGAAPGMSTVSTTLRILETQAQVCRVNRTTWRKLAPAPAEVSAPKAAPVRAFKVGDKVTGKSVLGSPITGLVSFVDPEDDSIPYRVRDDTQMDEVKGWWCRETHLSLVPSAPLTTDEKFDLILSRLDSLREALSAPAGVKE